MKEKGTLITMKLEYFHSFYLFLKVGFLSAICIPCYELLNRLIPNTEQLLEGCKSNLDRWKDMVEEEKTKEKEKAALKSSSKEEDGEEETDTGIEEVNEEDEDEEGEETLEDIDDEYINNDKDQGGGGEGDT